MNDIITSLSSLKIGEHLKGVKVKTCRTIVGCHKCVFQKRQGAQDCSFAPACFGHLREDKQSVIFIER